MKDKEMDVCKVIEFKNQKYVKVSLKDWGEKFD